MNLCVRSLNNNIRYASVLVLAMIVSACDSGVPEATAPDVPETTNAQDSLVLAEVNGSPITEADVDLALERTFSEVERLNANAELRQKVLESLVASRAMSQRAESQLAPEEVERIEGMARAYEEELRVKAYLQANTDPQPVTAAQVQAYYQEHPERFGAEPLHDFEMLKAPADLSDSERARVLGAVATIQGTTNWQQKSREWQAQYGLRYQALNQSPSNLLEAPLADALIQLSEGETSGVVYLDGQIHLLRLGQTTQSAAKPLSEVSSDIRKVLAPLQLREAVKAASEKAQAEAEIRYLNQ